MVVESPKASPRLRSRVVKEMQEFMATIVSKELPSCMILGFSRAAGMLEAPAKSKEGVSSDGYICICDKVGSNLKAQDLRVTMDFYKGPLLVLVSLFRRLHQTEWSTMLPMLLLRCLCHYCLEDHKARSLHLHRTSASKKRSQCEAMYHLSSLKE